MNNFLVNRINLMAKKVKVDETLTVKIQVLILIVISLLQIFIQLYENIMLHKGRTNPYGQNRSHMSKPSLREWLVVSVFLLYPNKTSDGTNIKGQFIYFSEK